MELDVLNTLLQLLCPTSNSMNSCQSFVQSPSHQVLLPLGPLLYFFFFPSVIILLFIYILSSKVLGGGGLNNGLRLLIAIAVYVFMIINGWYPLFLWISDLWFILIILLGGFWYFLSSHGGGGSGGGMPSIGGSKVSEALSSGGGWAKESLFGNKPIDPREIVRKRKLLKDKIKVIDAQIAEQEDKLKDITGDRERAVVREIIAKLQAERKVFEIDLKSLGG